ncbi:MAG TPA: hypothetical protein DCM08_08815 [Microscillaceae bacterium]|nr:hypothetical protein [Microscillaceae bacterium]
MTVISDFYNFLNNQNIIFSYKGILDSEVIEYILKIADKQLDVQVSKKVRKKLINISVECLQNSFHYLNKFGEQHSFAHSAFLFIQELEDQICLFSGNCIKQEAADELVRRIEMINQMNDIELQAHYINYLDREPKPNQIGAGLGLVDMIRRTGNKLDYQLISLPEALEGEMLFALQVQITKN